jgi:butyryl-CoA dehydrogenase
MQNPSITLPDWRLSTESESLGDLVATLAKEDGPADDSGVWPDRLWSILKDAHATRWALPDRFGASPPDRPSLLVRYARVGEGSLTAAFILTQHDAAIRRLALATGSGKTSADEWLDRIAEGTIFPTVGISQLTTSRRHGPRAVVARTTPTGFQLDGTMPWVTAAEKADLFVTGGAFDDGQQMLVAVPRERAGLSVHPAFELAALGASRTSEIICEALAISPEDVLAGPSQEVMATPGLAGTGGLETSALALGQARAALVALAEMASERADLLEPLTALSATWKRVADNLLTAAEGRADALPPATVRGEANDLVLRTTQSYLTARKGTGFLRSEPAQRWARQALFFLVWSCPSPVAQAAIRDLAGLCDA